MAAATALRVFLPAAALVGATQATAVSWSADMNGLDHGTLTAAEELQLSEGYAAEIAAIISADPASVVDLNGRPGRVSLAAAPSQTQASTTSRPTTASTTAAAETTAETTTAAARTTLAPRPTTAPVLDDSGMPALSPLRGVAYGPLPCREQCAPIPSEDMLQAGYEEQWGPNGRNDLGVIHGLGANAVRLYHSLGTGSSADHGGFLDRAQALGLNVLPGYHTEMANHPGQCPEYDCFETWKQATLDGFQLGFKQGGAWHPSVAMLVLLNEPDFFEFQPKCQPSGAWCYVKAALSAMDGVLAAEREAGVAPGRVKLSVTWSFAIKKSIDGLVEAPGLFGFQDMVAGIADPQLAHYSPRTPQADLAAAFQARWVHGLNTQSPWSFVQEVISRGYAPYLPLQWFIGEYGANGQPRSVIEADLESMNRYAQENAGFMGAAMFQFQTAYFKGGSELNFGLFSLGEEVIGTTGEVCDDQHPCATWPVHCLSTDLHLEGTVGERAEATAAAWGGAVNASSLCAGSGGERRLASATASTHLACTVQVPDGRDEAEVRAALAQDAVATRLASHTVSTLGATSDAITGSLALVSVSAESSASPLPEAQAAPDSAANSAPAVVFMLVGVVIGCAAFGVGATLISCCRGRQKSEMPPTRKAAAGSPASDASLQV